MIKLLGFKRALLLGIFLAINLAIAGLYLLVVEPMRAEASTALTTIKGENSTLQGNIQSIKMEMQTLRESMPKYEAFRTRGFYLPQDRFEVSRHLEELKDVSGVSSFAFDIAPLTEIANPEAAAVQKRLIVSRIKLDPVSAPIDISFFDLLQAIDDTFPMHTRIQSFELKKSGPVNAAALDLIRQGKGSSIQASVIFDWVTMVDLPPPVPPAGGM